MKRKIALEIISFLFILLFMYAGLSKLMDYQRFTVEIGQSPLLAGFGRTLPWMVIGVEIMIVGLFLIPRQRLYALFGAFSLITMFTAYIIAILNFSPYVPCSCGGVLDDLGWMEHLIFNSLFVFLGFAGIVLQAEEIKAEKTSRTINQNSLT